jgi:hypothetical protein
MPKQASNVVCSRARLRLERGLDRDYILTLEVLEIEPEWKEEVWLATSAS